MAKNFMDLLGIIEALLNEASQHTLPQAVEDKLAELLAEYESLTGINFSE